MKQNRVKIPKQIKLNTKLGEWENKKRKTESERERGDDLKRTGKANETANAKTEMARNCRRQATEAAEERGRGRGQRGLRQERDNCGRSFRLLSFGRVADSINFWGARRGWGGVAGCRKSQTTRDLGKLENGAWQEDCGRGAAGHKC